MAKRTLPAVLILLTTSVAATVSSQPTPKKKKPAPTAAKVKKLIGDLDDKDYFVRQRATRMLVEAGSAGVPMVTETALKGSLEAATRAMTVLAILVESPDTKAAAVAEKGLRKIAASKNEKAARRAAFLLRRPNRLRTMKRLLGDIRITVPGKSKPAAVLKTSVEKLYRFSDKSRTHVDGGLSVWTRDGRPAAFVKLWTVEGEEQRWGHGFISAAATPLDGGIVGKPVWTPAAARPQRAGIPKAPDAAKKKLERLRQMAALAKRFTAREFWEPGRTEYKLELRPEPILRFDSGKQGVRDGAVFAFCHESNPEAILVLEAVERKGKAAGYQYSVFRGGDSELHVELDGQEVMVRPRTNGTLGKPTDTYRVQIRTLTDESGEKSKPEKP
jgi:hypothetical protein